MFHCAVPVMWEIVRPLATMFGLSVLLWFEAWIPVILLVRRGNNTRKGSNNRLLHLVDAGHFFYSLILDAYRVISNVSL